jgi:NADH-quinone oxidoreductase subunit N
VVLLGTIFILVGIAFKLAAVPFHFWCPDVFEGASIDVTTFLSVASKGAGLILLMRVMMTVANAAGFGSTSTMMTLAVVIGILGAVSATVGNTAAFFQHNIKRLLAYSSIAHAGYMLCAVSLLVKSKAAEPGYVPSAAAAQAILFYLAVYLFMNLGAFSIAGVVSRQTGSENLHAFAGLARRAPLLAGCMTLFMFSLVGLPPLAGFSAKVNLLWVLIQNGSWWWILVAVIGVNTVFSLYFYVRVVKAMYLETSDEPAFIGQPVGVGLAMVSAVMLLVLFFGWNGLSRLTTSYQRLYLPVSGTASVEKLIVDS